MTEWMALSEELARRAERQRAGGVVTRSARRRLRARRLPRARPSARRAPLHQETTAPRRPERGPARARHPRRHAEPPAHLDRRKGDAHVEIHARTSRRDGAAIVRVVVSDREDGTHDRFYVVDLGKKRDDGGYAARTMPAATGRTRSSSAATPTSPKVRRRTARARRRLGERRSRRRPRRRTARPR